YKKYMHEGGIATPSIWFWPRAINQPGGFTDGVGHIIDLMPTLRELSGAAADGHLPGISLVPLLKLNDMGNRHNRTLYWEHEGNQAIRKGDWKLVKDKEDSMWALYQLDRDPTESQDLSTIYPQKALALKDTLDRRIKPIR